MNPRVLSKEAWGITRELVRAELTRGWTLAGGTALALQLGYRVSMDLDFFAEVAFDADALRRSLAALGVLELQAQAEDTLHVQLSGLRLSFLRSEAPFLFPKIPYRGLELADVRDIAAMKIVAIAGRGSRKDFIDLYSYLEAGGDFPSLMAIVRNRYADTIFNEVHLLRSLVYFHDAEQEPMPTMLQPLDWDTVRTRLEEEVRQWAP